MGMKEGTDVILLRIYVGEEAEHEGKPLYRHIVELVRKEGIAGATVLRGVSGYGVSSRLRTTSILRLSTDLPLIIEIVDTAEAIGRIRPLLASILTAGLITEEHVRVVACCGKREG